MFFERIKNNYFDDNKNSYNDGDFEEKLSYLKKYFSIIDHKKLKKLNLKQIEDIAKKIREFIIEVVSKNGGHLSSNLGIVELTLAILYIFDPERDKIVFDVSHQIYPYKILTGRSNNFETLRKKGGISGFSDPEESIYDLFKEGHVGTAIGLVYGFSFLKEFYKKISENNFYQDISCCFKDKIEGDPIAIIGDGSLTNGEILETLNFIGNKKNGKIIIIINDNGMSISKTESAISKYISKLSARLNLRGFLKRIYLSKKITSRFYKILLKLIISVKGFFIPESILEEFGFQYIGPIDGHNLKELIEYLKIAKEIESPVILHVKTIKGKGFQPAEKYPDYFHSSPRFEIEKIYNEEYLQELFSKKRINIFTDFFERLVIFAGFIEKKIIALTSAMEIGTGLSSFAKLFPERFVDVGIAESTQVTISGSIAKASFVPICNIYSTFAQRALDQIYHDIVLNKLPMIFCFDRYGAVGNDGPTHHGFYTLNFLLSIPDIEIYFPFSEEDFAYYFISSINDGKIKAFFYPKDKIISLEGFKSDDKILMTNKINTKNRKEKDFNFLFIKELENLRLENIDKNFLFNHLNEIKEKYYENFMFEFEEIFIKKNRFYPFILICSDYNGNSYNEKNGNLSINNSAKKNEMRLAIVFSGAFFDKIYNIFKNIINNCYQYCNKNGHYENNFKIDVFSLSKIKPFSYEKAHNIIDSYNLIFIVEEVIEPGYIYANFLKILNENYKIKKIDNIPKVFGYCIKNKIIYHGKREEQLKEAGIDFEKIENDIRKEIFNME
ncbi:MAG: 1-deoxy-D-xylulose-5-phosphate synthase [Spirochaetes bacterium]|nr:1-deoxy-D-xylulose-5-phosphate synthase [Spirochaetota bacterium]